MRTKPLRPFTRPYRLARYLIHYTRLMCWESVSLGNRAEIPKVPGLYAVVSLGRVLYLGRSNNIHRRWTATGRNQHHRLTQAKDLVFPRLKYIELKEDQVNAAEKYWIKALGKPPWNYTKVPRHDWQPGEILGVVVMAGALVAVLGFVF